jgi:hypothetical protein
VARLKHADEMWMVYDGVMKHQYCPQAFTMLRGFRPKALGQFVLRVAVLLICGLGAA